MASQEHDWGSKEYSEEWATKDAQRAARREAQFQAATKWLAVFLPGNARVLDLGSGPGTLAEKILVAFPEMSVVWLDGSDAMLRLAKERLAPFSSRVSFVMGDFSQEEWTAGVSKELDAVVSARAVHNLRKLKPIEAVYKSVHEILRPGGLFLNIERVNFSSPALRKRYRELQVMESGRAPAMDGPAPSLLQQFRLLRRAGFRDIDCFWREGNTAIVGGFRKK